MIITVIKSLEPTSIGESQYAEWEQNEVYCEFIYFIYKL